MQRGHTCSLGAVESNSVKCGKSLSLAVASRNNVQNVLIITDHWYITSVDCLRGNFSYPIYNANCTFCSQAWRSIQYSTLGQSWAWLWEYGSLHRQLQERGQGPAQPWLYPRWSNRAVDGSNLLLTALTCSDLTLISLTDDEDEDEEDEDGDAGTQEAEGAQTVSGGGAVTAASIQPSAPQQSNSSPSTATSSAST